jgi:RimK-like ATP-grasp domain
MIYIVTPKLQSKFAKAIQQGLKELTNERVLRTTKQKPRSFVVTPNSLNKIEQFTRFASMGVPSPASCTQPSDVNKLPGRSIFARTLVNSTNGRGIIEFEKEDGVVPNAPLYTEYIPKKSEYRVHVLNGEVIDVQQKKKKRGFESARNTRIRNLNNGYVYCRDDIAPPDGIANLAISAVAALGYTYGAVDIIYNEKRNQCFVLEVNSRPGLTGTTLTKYCQAILKGIN